MKLTVVGINFKTAPLDLREQVSLTQSQVPQALKRLNEQMPGSEVLLLSTCNRMELYMAGENISVNKGDQVKWLGDSAGVALSSDNEKHFYFKEGPSAGQHLMAVSAGLDSMVVGETEILGQVKQAYMLASDLQPNCKFLHRFLHAVFRAAKRVHTETDICRGRVSVSSITVEFAKKIFDNLSAKTVMIVGAGETGELTLKSLVEKGVRNVVVLNRSLEKGRALAERHGGRAIQFELLDDFLPQVDIVISCTDAPHCVIRADTVKRAVSARHDRPILLIDIAVPRDIEEEVGDLENVYLYHIDDLQTVAEANLAQRQQAVLRAWVIVREEASEFSALFLEPSLGTVMRVIN